MSPRERLEQYFRFAKLETGWRTEILAGCTTFMTMAYTGLWLLSGAKVKA